MSLLKKIQMEKITSKNTNRALRNTNADKTTVLLNDSFLEAPLDPEALGCSL